MQMIIRPDVEVLDIFLLGDSDIDTKSYGRKRDVDQHLVTIAPGIAATLARWTERIASVPDNDTVSLRSTQLVCHLACK